MTPSSSTGGEARARAWLLPLALTALLTLPARAQDEDPRPAPRLDTSARLWLAPEGSRGRADSPFAPAAALAGIGRDTGSWEGVLRAHRAGLTAELALHLHDRGAAGRDAAAVVTELYQELDGRAGHLTLGKKVTSWDVAYAFRPLDVVQQERRRAFVPFGLEGIPQVSFERFGERSALSLLWVNPLQGRRALAPHDESGAARLFARAGSADLHAVLRWSERTRLQAGAGVALVVGDALELHGSASWQERGERLAAPAPGAPPVSATPPGVLRTRGAVAAVAGLTFTPGLDLSLLAEAWLDPGGDTPAAWRRRRALAEAQRTLLDGGGGPYPREALEGNLAWGLMAFDRPSLLRQNLFLRLSQKRGRLEPSVDVLVTPEDRGWVATAAASWQGERLRAEGGLRIMGGPPGAAYRLYPSWAMFYGAAQVSF